MIKLGRTSLRGLGAPQPAVANVRAALQQAIELEHSTIPPYLYAKFSLVPGKNNEVARIIHSVVVEEMLHMVLAANVLNALGGRPAISKPTFVPAYPGPLPGGVEGQLHVHLRPFSREQLTTFIEIEEPRHPIDDGPLEGDEGVGECTIGEFYNSIAGAITRMGNDAFLPTPHHQIGPDLVWGAVEVCDVESACAALEVIIEQGEGTGTSPIEIDNPDGENDFAHYYRFMEIHHGRRLEADPASPHGYSYTGDEVAVDPEGVVALPDDPTSADYPPGSQPQALNDAFNDSYSQLLAVLHHLTNGGGTAETFGSSMMLMKKLERQARAMADYTASTGDPAGPTFEYRAPVG
jgi:Ferritin-like